MTQMVIKGAATDDQIAEILLAPPGLTNAELAREYRLPPETVRSIRHRRSWRAIRMADALGLTKRKPRLCVDETGRDVLAPAYVLAVKAAVLRTGRPRKRRRLEF